MKNSDNKISTFLTIQEGCDKFCKFCVVPYTRGPECSRPFSEIVAEARQVIDNGSREIILLGQNVNAYNHKDKKLSDLVSALNDIKNLKGALVLIIFRLITLEFTLRDDLCRLVAVV